MKKVRIQQIDQLINTYCSEEWVYLLRERSTENFFQAKTTIFEEGDTMEKLSIIKSGKVKIYTTQKAGKERIYRFATKGQIIGHRGFGKDFMLPISALALTDTSVIDIPLSLFQNLLKANAAFCYHFMLFMAEELKESECYIKNMNDMDLRQRIAQALLMNAKAFGFDKKDPKKLSYTLSRKELSSISDSTYESVIRTLSQFKKEGLIELVNKEIKISNYKKLEEIL